MLTATNAYKAASDDPQRITQKKIVFNGTDVSSRIEDMGDISLRQYEGDDVSAIPVTISLLNNDKGLNSIRTDKPGNYGKAGTLSLGFDGEYVDIFKGYLTQAEFAITDQHRCKLTLSHRLQTCVQTTVGSTDYPVTYTARNPADLAWTLCVDKGGLDGTASAANTDIDYASWSEFWTVCDDLGLSFKGNCTGESIAELLRLIGWLSDAVIYPDPSGKITFKKFVPRESGTASYAFTDADAHVQATSLYANFDRVINKLKAFYGYDTATATWAGTYTAEDATSQTNYGVYGREADSSTIFHATLGSATAWADRMVARYTDPPDTLEIKTTRGTQALLHQIGDTPTVTVAKHDLSSLGMQVYGIEHVPMTGEVRLLLEDLGSLNQNFFILDSATNGVLDTNILY